MDSINRHSAAQLLAPSKDQDCHLASPFKYDCFLPSPASISKRPDAPVMLPISRFSTWSSTGSERDDDDDDDDVFDITEAKFNEDACFTMDEDLASPALTDGESCYSPCATTPMYNSSEDPTLRSEFFLAASTKLEEQQTTPCPALKRPNLKRFGKYFKPSAVPLYLPSPPETPSCNESSPQRAQKLTLRTDRPRRLSPFNSPIQANFPPSSSSPSPSPLPAVHLIPPTPFRDEAAPFLHGVYSPSMASPSTIAWVEQQQQQQQKQQQQQVDADAKQAKPRKHVSTPAPVREEYDASWRRALYFAGVTADDGASGSGRPKALSADLPAGLRILLQGLGEADNSIEL